MFEYFLHKFGLYTLAMKHMVKLVGSLLGDVGKENPLVMVFKKCCYLHFDDPEQNLTRDSLDLILSVVMHTTTGKGEPLPEYEPHNRHVPLSRMRSGLKEALQKVMPLDALNTALTRICNSHTMLRGAGASSHQEIACVSICEGMAVAAAAGRQARLDRQVPLMQLFANVDVDGDGVMQFDEFKEAVRHLLPEVTKSDLMRMFREALTRSKHSNPNALTATAFANTILAHQGYSSTMSR